MKFLDEPHSPMKHPPETRAKALEWSMRPNSVGWYPGGTLGIPSKMDVKKPSGKVEENHPPFVM